MSSRGVHDGGPLVRRAAGSTVASLFFGQARLHPERAAIVDGPRLLTYAALADRVRRLAGVLDARGLGRGARLAILSENRAEYLELFLAAATVGAVVACPNCRLAPPELAQCLDLVEPEAVLASPRHAPKLAAAGARQPPLLFGGPYEEILAAQSPRRESAAPASGDPVDPEDPLLILYTSGTTGLPKGAVLSHRAEIARNLVLRAEYGLAASDTFVAWSPLYHMGAADCSLGTLMAGGKVITIDGFDRVALAQIVGTEALGLLLLMPGMVSAFAAELEARAVRPKGVKICGVMADLVPAAEIARITRLLGAPYGNTFGATETGWPPASSNNIPVGVAPKRLPKEQSPFCEVKLVDPDDAEVPDGQPGELCMRGPTLFSGYFRADAINAQEFRGGWFHLGDVFVRNPDGTLDFVDRVKYLIKSGGENIYPAEIERLMLRDARVAEAAVVRAPDPKWGEVPIAFVARRDPALTEGDLLRLCRAGLAGYKQPKEIRFISVEDFPRSASGKIQRHELEKLISTR